MGGLSALQSMEPSQTHREFLLCAQAHIFLKRLQGLVKRLKIWGHNSAYVNSDLASFQVTFIGVFPFIQQWISLKGHMVPPVLFLKNESETFTEFLRML